MGLKYDTYEDYAGIVMAELRRQVPSVDPSVRGHWATAFLNGAAALASALSLSIRDLQAQAFPQTATEEFLDLWGEWENLPRPGATAASGNVVFVGSNLTAIPSGTQIRGRNGLIYATTEAGAIGVVNLSMATLTRAGNTVTATTAEPHNLGTGIQVTISGASPSDYNGTFEIIVTGERTFTYTITTTPTTPATGTIVVQAVVATIPAQATTTGENTNIAPGGEFTLVNSITGINDPQVTDARGFNGGANIADDEQYRSLIIRRRNTIEGDFTINQISLAVLNISGNTRVFVKRPTTAGAGGAIDPEPGQTSVFYVRDNDANIAPSAPQIAETRAAIIANGALPAHMAEADLFVQAPFLPDIPFTFTALDPDTPTMQAAIEANLGAFFNDSIEFETNIPEERYVAAIQNTVDPDTGDTVEAFTLSTPTGVIPVSGGQLPVLGAVTFST